MFNPIFIGVILGGIRVSRLLLALKLSCDRAFLQTVRYLTLSHKNWPKRSDGTMDWRTLYSEDFLDV
jgi:hypothetical protein